MDFLKIPSNCAYDLGLNLEQIDECVNGTRGTELQLEAEKYSKDVIDDSGFVPTMTYGQKFNARSQQSSLNRFHEVVKQQIEALSLKNKNWNKKSQLDQLKSWWKLILLYPLH